MAQVVIDLDQNEERALNYFANQNAMTPAEYGGNILRGWLKEQITGYYKGEFRKKTIPELVNLFGALPY